MGRHAAPSDDEPELADQSTVPLGAVAVARPPGSRPLPVPRGRHAHPDDDDDGDDDGDDDVATGVAADTPGDQVTQPVPAAPARVKKESATAADMRLLRTDRALRNRVTAGVIAPFVFYALILAVIGRMDAFAVWVWLPLITAGITAGVLLDRAHAKLAKADAQADAQAGADAP